MEPKMHIDCEHAPGRRIINRNADCPEAISLENVQASTDENALFCEEIGGVPITDKNLIGFHYRKHYKYDPTPRMVGDVDYPTCDTIDCDIFGQDEQRWLKKAHYSEAWCGVTPDCAFLTVEYFEDGRAKTITLREDHLCDESNKHGQLYDCAKRMSRVIRILRKGKPNANPMDIVRWEEPEPEIYSHAKKIAVEAHKGQKDKGGKDYVLHPIRVAERCKSADAKVVALLHDTIEDTAVTPDYLREQGFPEKIIEGVLSVTKREGESYEDFVRRAAQNPIGKEVKKADLEDNMDIRRLKEITDMDVERLRNYLRAWQYLNE